MKAKKELMSTFVLLVEYITDFVDITVLITAPPRLVPLSF